MCIEGMHATWFLYMCCLNIVTQCECHLHTWIILHSLCTETINRYYLVGFELNILPFPLQFPLLLFFLFRFPPLHKVLLFFSFHITLKILQMAPFSPSPPPRAPTSFSSLTRFSSQACRYFNRSENPGAENLVRELYFFAVSSNATEINFIS